MIAARRKRDPGYKPPRFWMCRPGHSPTARPAGSWDAWPHVCSERA